MIIDDIRTIVRLTFEDIKFQRLLKFALNRIFCEYSFEDEQVVIQGRSRWSGRSGHGRTGFGSYQIIDIYRFKSIISASSIKLYCLQICSFNSVSRTTS